jgi:hypothetical protein
MADESDARDEATGPDNGSAARDRFREALERKRSQQHARSDAHRDASKVHGEHAREGGKRQFRRKSG